MNDFQQPDPLDPGPPPAPPIEPVRVVAPPVAPPAAPYPGFWQTVGLLVLFFFFQIFAVVAIALMQPKGQAASRAMDHPLALWVLAAANILGFASVIWLGLRNAGTTWQLRMLRGSIPPAVVGPFLTCTFGMILTAAGVAIAATGLIVNSPFKKLAEGVGLPKGGIVATLFLLAVVAPLTEELFFRGLVMGGFLRRYSERKALLVSSALFGLMHMTPLQILPTFLIGLLLGWWRIRTGGVLLPILGHALHNSAIGILILAAGEKASGITTDASKIPLGQALGGAAVLLSIGLALLLPGLNRARIALTPPQPPELPMPGPSVEALPT